MYIFSYRSKFSIAMNFIETSWVRLFLSKRKSQWYQSVPHAVYLIWTEFDLRFHLLIMMMQNSIIMIAISTSSDQNILFIFLQKHAFKDNLPSRYIWRCVLAHHWPSSMYREWDHLIMITSFNSTPHLSVVEVSSH